MTTATSSTSSTNAYQCDWCGRISEKKLLKCGKCRIPRYCDWRCQTVHWPEHKLVCRSPNNATTDVTKSVVNKTLLNNAQAEQTTDTFNQLNNTVTLPAAPIAEPKKKPSLPASFDLLAQTRKTAAFLLGDQALVEKEKTYMRDAFILLKDGDVSGACDCIVKNTTQPLIKIGFIKEFAKHMCSLDKKNIKLVTKKATQILPDGRDYAVQAILDAKIFSSPKEIDVAESMPTSCDPFAKEQTITTVFGEPASIKKEKKYLGHAFVLLKTGKDSDACDYILKHTATNEIRVEFLKEFTRYMCSRDRENITLVLKRMPHILPSHWRTIVFDTLVEAKICPSHVEAEIFVSLAEIDKAFKHSSSEPSKNNDSSS